jgi:hypothetical protein
MFNSFGILTEKQIVRMADAELISDIADVIDRGIQNRQPELLKKLYQKNDTEFARRDEFIQKMNETLRFIRDDLGEIHNTFMCKSYAFHSLAAALMHNRWGIPSGINDLDSQPIGEFTANVAVAQQNILVLAGAHEANVTEGPLSLYVSACESTTHRFAQRRMRTLFIVKALNDSL